MKKCKRFLCVLCAACMMLSAAASAGAASFEDDPYYFGVDWSQVDTSMCISGTEYHRYPQTSLGLLADVDRNVFTGWVKGVPANSCPGALVTELIFENDETGVVEITFADTQGLNETDINVSAFHHGL